jgi:hypothetical protein
MRTEFVNPNENLKEYRAYYNNIDNGINFRAFNNKEAIKIALSQEDIHTKLKSIYISNTNTKIYGGN